MVSLIGGFNQLSFGGISGGGIVKEAEGGQEVEPAVRLQNDFADAKSVSEHGDTLKVVDSDFNTKIQYRPDYIEDLATENFNTINSLNE